MSMKPGITQAPRASITRVCGAASIGSAEMRETRPFVIATCAREGALPSPSKTSPFWMRTSGGTMPSDSTRLRRARLEAGEQRLRDPVDALLDLHPAREIRLREIEREQSVGREDQRL